MDKLPDWEMCRRLSDAPEVDGAIRAFLEEPTENSAVEMIRAALGALLNRSKPAVRLMHYVGTDEYARSTARVVARTYTECRENEYPETWREGAQLIALEFTQEDLERLQGERHERLEKEHLGDPDKKTGIYSVPAEPTGQCNYCKRFFSRFRCNSPGECDCPKCQGMCECAKPETAEPTRASLTHRLADHLGLETVDLRKKELKPCRSPYCECEPGKCTHPGCYDARHEPMPAEAIADALDAVETTPGTPDPRTVLKRLQEANAAVSEPDTCPKCGKPWANHEFAVPAPYCPGE